MWKSQLMNRAGVDEWCRPCCQGGRFRGLESGSSWLRSAPVAALRSRPPFSSRASPPEGLLGDQPIASGTLSPRISKNFEVSTYPTGSRWLPWSKAATVPLLPNFTRATLVTVTTPHSVKMNAFKPS
jgi:hypothetical protein